MLAHVTTPAVAVDLPGRGSHPADIIAVTLGDCVGAVIGAADLAGFDRFALVGHSLGGVTITETAVRYPGRVSWLIYVGAVVPGPGQSAGLVTVGADYPEGRPVWPDSAAARSMFGPGLTEAQSAQHWGRLVPEAPQLLNARLSGYPSGIPTTYVSLTEDAGVLPALAEQMIANLGGDVDHRVLRAGHLVMISQPRELAALIDSVVG